MKLTGLIAAPHTPFHADFSLNLRCVNGQAAHLAANGVAGAFVAGTTGESHSLSTPERADLFAAWGESAPAQGVQFIAHIGHNNLPDACALAAAAREAGIPGLEGPGIVKGQVAVVFGESDIASAAKVVKDFAKDAEKPKIRYGYIGEDRLEEDAVLRIADLPPMDVLRGQLLGVIQAPATQLARVVNTPASMLARVLQAKVDKGE